MKYMIEYNGRRVIVDNGVINMERSFAGSIKVANEMLSEVIEHVADVQHEFAEEFERIQGKRFDDIIEMYQFYEKLYHESRFESIKRLARSAMNFIENVARLANIEVFSMDKKRLFINNLAKALARIGYDVRVTSITSPFEFEIIDRETGITEFFRIDSSKFAYVFSDDVLSELVNENNVLHIADSQIVRRILERVRRYFKVE